MNKFNMFITAVCVLFLSAFCLFFERLQNVIHEVRCKWKKMAGYTPGGREKDHTDRLIKDFVLLIYIN